MRLVGDGVGGALGAQHQGPTAAHVDARFVRVRRRARAVPRATPRRSRPRRCRARRGRASPARPRRRRPRRTRRRRPSTVGHAISETVPQLRPAMIESCGPGTNAGAPASRRARARTRRVSGSTADDRPRAPSSARRPRRSARRRPSARRRGRARAAAELLVDLGEDRGVALDDVARGRRCSPSHDVSDTTSTSSAASAADAATASS